MGIDIIIMGVDIMGVDILGLDTQAPTHSLHSTRSSINK